MDEQDNLRQKALDSGVELDLNDVEGVTFFDTDTAFHFFRSNTIRNFDGFSGEMMFRVYNTVAANPIMSGTRQQRRDQLIAEGFSQNTIRQELAQLATREEELRQTFEMLLLEAQRFANLVPGDRMLVRITDQEIGISTGMKPFQNITADELLQKTEKVQSQKTFQLPEMRVWVTFSKTRNGGSYSSATINPEEFVKKKRCVVEIKTTNNRNDCFFQCLAFGMADGDAYAKLNWSNAQKAREEIGESYRQVVKVHQPNQNVSFESMRAYEDILHINIYVIEFMSMKFVRISSTNYERKMFLLYVTKDGVGHYHFINPKMVNALWNRRRFCFKCMKAYQDIRHACIKKCYGCHRNVCKGAGELLSSFRKHCDTCNLAFFDDDCFSFHKKKLCEKEHKCRECNLIYNVSKVDHQCGFHECLNCKEYVEADHKCYHQPLEVDKLPKILDKFIFYDYEAVMDGLTHQVAGIVAMYGHSDEFFRFQTTDDFIEWILRIEHKGFTCIAHNAGKYDMHFIKKAMLSKSIKSKDIVKGNNIFYSHVKKFDIRFIDSYRFIPISLRKFPKTFGITEVAKGYFPYKFFTKENMNYVGPMPPIEKFSFNQLSIKEHEDAVKWHNEHKNDTINLYEMCMEYCESDVLLLKEGCMKFHELFLKVTKDRIGAFNYITIASLCLNIYRHFNMPSKTIGIFKPYQESIWMRRWKYLNNMEPEIVHDVEVDGRIDDKVFFFNICVDNGCNKCFSAFSSHPITFKKMHQLRYEWRKKVQKLRSNGLQVETTWECQFCDVYNHSMVLKEQCMGMPDSISLNMRDAFYGGRTEPLKLYYEVQEGEKIRYYDYTSLYPSVQYGLHRGITPDTIDETRTLYYPVGHPTVITENFKPIDEYFGFIKCHVIPPDNLYHPVLPARTGGKLKFDLRQKTGTWTTIEVLKAIEMGYVVDHIYEIVHFEEKTDKLFDDYVKTFLKIKQQAAGWKKLGCKTDEEKRSYCEQYLREQEIELDPTEIGEYNPGLYFIAKQCLNSLWGKFGQRDVFTETVDTFDHDAFVKVAHSDHYDVTNVVLHDNVARSVTYKKRREFQGVPKNTNIAIAAFTTAHARLRLYEALEVLGEDVLYMDTDSVIFVERGGVQKLKCGPYLGDLTDELDDPEEHIVKFVSTAPKSYAYITNFGRECCKIKGFTLNKDTSALLNYGVLKDLVAGDVSEVLTSPLQFLIDPHHNIRTKDWNEGSKKKGKSFKLTFDKRKISCVLPHIVDTEPIKKRQRSV